MICITGKFPLLNSVHSARTLLLQHLSVCSKERAAEQEAERREVFPRWRSRWTEIKSSANAHNDQTG